MWGIVYLPDWDIPLQEPMYRSDDIDRVSDLAARLNTPYGGFSEPRAPWIVVSVYESGGRLYVSHKDDQETTENGVTQ